MLLEKALLLSPNLEKNKLKIIQNGIPLADIDKLIRKREKFKNRNIDICWIRGVSNVYQFEYFLKLLKIIKLFQLQKLMYILFLHMGELLYQNKYITIENIIIKLLPRLNSKDFYQLYIIVKLLFQSQKVTQVQEAFMRL